MFRKITLSLSSAVRCSSVAFGMLGLLMPAAIQCSELQSLANKSLVSEIATLRPSIVEILVGGQRSGTGFVISKNGHILTATHVVAEFPSYPTRYRQNIEVKFSDGTRIPATPVENPDPDSLFRDIAVLNTGRQSTVPLKLSKHPMVGLGSEVILMGFPLQQPEAVVYTGIVASEYDLSAGIVGDHEVIKRMIQIEAPVAKGFSGSPLIDLRTGEVVGVTEIKIGGINQRLEEVGAQIQSSQGHVVITMGGVNTNDTLLNLIAVLDQYLSAGTGSAVSIEHIRGFVQHLLAART